MSVCPHNNFERFSYFVLPDNRYDVMNTPISTDPDNPTPIAQLAIHSDPGDIVRLRATIGWRGTVPFANNVSFAIWRDAPVTGTLIFEAIETSETNLDRSTTTDFSNDDTFFPEERVYNYYLTAYNISALASFIVGPITFTAAEIEHCSG